MAGSVSTHPYPTIRSSGVPLAVFGIVDGALKIIIGMWMVCCVTDFTRGVDSGLRASKDRFV